MRLLYLHQYFKTPEEGGAIRSYYIGKALAERGHQVLMITSWNGHHYKTEKIAGMEVHYLPVPYRNSMGFWGRMKAFGNYLRQARQTLNLLQPADIVYATSTPLSIGLLALYTRWRYKIPYIFEVRDLWPEAPIQLGFMRNKLLINALRKLERKIYQQAQAVVALSPGIANGVMRAHPTATVHFAPNMADCSFFVPGPKPEKLIRQWGLEGKFVISYTGAAGLANHLTYLLKAAEACDQEQLPVKFLLAAEGAQLEDLKGAAKELSNLIFLPYGSKELVRDYLAVSDAVYISFGPQPVLQSCSPNKFFDGLAAGKLCIVNTIGWLKELVEKSACGFYANPERPEAFVERLKPYLRQPGLLQEAQLRARMVAEKRFDRKQITTGIVQLIEEQTNR